MDKMAGSMESNSPNSLHIAVTGHRFIPKDTTTLSDAIRQVFQDILSHHTETSILLLSALAEGSDQLVARVALEFPVIKIRAPLPKAEGDYLVDFYSEEGRNDFKLLILSADSVIQLNNLKKPKNAYRALGKYLVQQADLLLAVWNGVCNQKSGGTGEVVKSALDVGKPVYWIYSPNLKHGENNPYNHQKQIGDIEYLNDPCPLT
jgi:hypothetical protein